MATFKELGAKHRASGAVRMYVILSQAVTNILKAIKVGHTKTIDGVRIKHVKADQYEADGVQVSRHKLVGMLLGERTNPLPIGRHTGYSVRISKRGYGPFTVTEGGAMSEARAKRVAAAHARRGFRADVLHGGSVVDMFAPSKSNPRRKKRAKPKAAPKRRRRRNLSTNRRRADHEAYTKGVVAAFRKMGYRVKVQRGVRR
jgi:hypothetical protein